MDKARTRHGGQDLGTRPAPAGGASDVPAPWQVTREGVVLTVRLTPRGGRDALEAVETLADGRSVLKARVRAAPSEGEANAALLALLAREFGLPRSRLAITGGATARLKAVLLQGDPAALTEALRRRFIPA